ncbi:MAG: aldo/keto reductase [Terriglobia bacterium]
MSKSVNRREFIRSALAVGALSAVSSKAAEDAPGRLPTRTFGRTGLRPSVLAIGCGSRLMAYGQDDRILEALELALASGITYFDTAQDYGGGRSEPLVGQATKGRRQGLILATKTHARTADEVMRRAEQSLKRLQVDQLDVLHIHEVLGPDDLQQVEAKGGALEGAYKLREQKMVRALGISCHGNPESLAQALERHDFDCVQMALNAALQGRMPNWLGFLKKDQQDMFSEARIELPGPGAPHRAAEKDGHHRHEGHRPRRPDRLGTGKSHGERVDSLRALAPRVGRHGRNAASGVYPREHGPGAQLCAPHGK